MTDSVAKSIGQKRVEMVLNRMIALSNGDEDYTELFTECLEDMLDEIVGEDAFGTELQDDPRGDGREGEWNMWKVQGVGD